ncbi:MAG TPA: hypothetical protein VFB15_00235 [Candidatus Binataceae bacterium]|nr:hypothetical protein [Candidatus Binataceae bacterium]
MSKPMRRALLTLICCGWWGAQAAMGMEPRPWLCRQIPVFSDDKPMSWSAQRSGPGEWVMTFMRYDPSGGGHDGFTVISTEAVSPRAAGMLNPGRYYAVALHRMGSHWICPENASPAGAAADDVTRICFGADEDSCDVRFRVRAADHPSP